MSLKLKRKRTKFHISAPKLKLKDNEGTDETTIPLLEAINTSVNTSTALTPPPVAPIPDEFMNKTPFVGLTDDTSEGSKVEDTLNGGSVKMKKKDKRKQRHEKWMKKINACYKARELAKATLKRRKTPVVGDLRPLLSALPDVDLDTNAARGSTTAPKNKKGKKNKKQNTAYQEREVFQQVLSHPKYKADPLGTISLHIQNAAALQRL
ncbi:PREDICTED: protein FAM207A-like [Amphimedon queenslandica]|uniref:Ribosome biogenesis protein SLX9 n=1 Tax=Amphimedon queenslandica TaxID=400682 RepID=A0A1X7VDN9_AMPQE|nr:PREDICTED: protein FAM207A-like [Amphimedon queenslandica]|eukprot:XP_003384596.1 PREDICTED: protein FAM207A-like [Amphimedon queenslandica]